MKPIGWLALLCLSGALGATGCSSAPAASAGAIPHPAAFDRHADVVYSPPGWPESLQADVYVPAGPGPFPAVLVIHGGGWIIGSRTETASISRRLARNGYVAVNVDYRLLPDYRFPAPLRDVQQALRWMKSQAPRFRIDPQRLATWGYSAGAQLAALLGTLSPGDAYFASDARVRAVVAGGTPADLRPLAGSSLVQQYLGGSLAQVPDRYRDASPTALVSAADAPTFLYAGTADAMVPPRCTRDLKSALDGAGVPNEVFWVPDRGHLTTFLFDDAPAAAAIRFLDRYLKTSGS